MNDGRSLFEYPAEPPADIDPMQRFAPNSLSKGGLPSDSTLPAPVDCDSSEISIQQLLARHEGLNPESRARQFVDCFKMFLSSYEKLMVLIEKQTEWSETGDIPSDTESNLMKEANERDIEITGLIADLLHYCQKLNFINEKQGVPKILVERFVKDLGQLIKTLSQVKVRITNLPTTIERFKNHLEDINQSLQDWPPKIGK